MSKNNFREQLKVPLKNECANDLKTNLIDQERFICKLIEPQTLAASLQFTFL